MQQAFDSYLIEKNIKSKIGDMSKGIKDMAIAYLGYKHNSSLKNGDEKMAKSYLDFISLIK